MKSKLFQAKQVIFNTFLVSISLFIVNYGRYVQFSLTLTYFNFINIIINNFMYLEILCIKLLQNHIIFFFCQHHIIIYMMLFRYKL